MINTTGYGGNYPPSMMNGMRHHPDPSKMAQQLLSAADTNGDGSISKAEFTSLMQGAGKTSDSNTIDNLFSMLDQNGDGSVSGQETTDALTTMFDNMRNHLLQARGLAAGGRPGDADGDGDQGRESGAQAAAEAGPPSTAQGTATAGVNPRIAFLLQGLLNEYQANQSPGSDPGNSLLTTSA